MRDATAKTVFLILSPFLALGVAACRHKAAPPVPQASTAPPLPPSSMTQTPAVPKMPPPAEPNVGVPGSDVKAKDVEPPVPPKPHHKKHTAQPPVTDAASGSTPGAAGTASTTAAAQPAPAVPPAATVAPAPSLGELAPGKAVDNHERAAMAEQIHTQELRLSKLKQPMNEEDRAITLQVQAFLAKARQAISENDLDGAQTLTTKAKVLLDELSQS